MTAESQKGRRASKDTRRRQLIEATIACIAKRGLGDTTLAHVSKTAGLSQGIVNLHFTNKVNLMNETLSFIRDEYEQTWQNALEKAGDNSARQLSALARIDYSATVADPKRLAVWFAFWGEVKSRPVYKKICQSRVTDYRLILVGILNKLIDNGCYKELQATNIADSMMSMADGLWLNMLISSHVLKRKDAEKLMMQYLAQTFPQHKNYFLDSHS